MLINIAITLMIAVGGLAAFVATRPAEFRIARSRTLAASPGVAGGRLAKAFSLDFERGLANLDAATAAPMRQARPGS